MEYKSTIQCHLYNKDPILRIENEIRSANLKEPLQVEELLEFDQMHYLGTEAIDKAIASIFIENSHLVLDIGCGFGGPARYLAKKVGCQVHGIEIQEKIAEFAQQLNMKVNMQEQVHIRTGNFLNLEITQTYDRIISYLVFLHIPDKTKLWSQLAASLKEKAQFYVEDFIRLRQLEPIEEKILKSVVGAEGIQDLETYRYSIEKQGLEVNECIDLSKIWATWTKERANAYLKQVTEQAKKHGVEAAEHMLEFFQVVAKLFAEGAIGGIAIRGIKNPQ
ncbi:MAG: cyclopropane-fatty-acyl-phospholipid synthase family protein [Oligoflexales bacterium]